MVAWKGRHGAYGEPANMKAELMNTLQRLLGREKINFIILFNLSISLHSIDELLAPYFQD